MYNMEKNFNDLVQKQQINGCKTCRTIAYTLPQPISKKIADFLAPMGQLQYDIEVYSIIKIDNDAISLNSRLGSVDINVKFKNKDDMRIVSIFEIQLAAYLQSELNIPISGV